MYLCAPLSFRFPLPPPYLCAFSYVFPLYLATLADVSNDRLGTVSFDSVLGIAQVDILPQPTGGLDVHGLNVTAWSSTFLVSNLSSVSLATAKEIVAEAGINYVSVQVNGNVVTFLATSITKAMLAALANISSVDAASISSPGLFVPGLLLVFKFLFFC